MEGFTILDKSNIHELKDLMENDNMVFDVEKLREFVETDGAYGFLYRTESRPIGLAYGCRLTMPDGQREMYLHSIDILPEYQNRGHGTKFFESILDFSKNNGFCGMFLCSSQSLGNARHIYEKFGGVRECEDEIIFNYSFTKR